MALDDRSAQDRGERVVDLDFETVLGNLVSRHFITAELGESLTLSEKLGWDLSHGRLAQCYFLIRGFCEVVGTQVDLRRVMEAGDLLLVFGRAGISEAARLRPLHVGQGCPGEASLLRGGFTLTGSRNWPLSRLLPTLLHLKASEHAWLRPIGSALAELAQLGAGGRPALLRLLEVVLIQALLSGLPATLRQSIGKSLTDRAVGGALQRMHSAPEQDWSVERLADEIGASRSAFARRFTEAIGSTPMRYLTQMRMDIAEQTMRVEPGITLAQLATRLGYSSEFSLSKAFRRHFGRSPSAHTRAHKRDGQASS